MKKIHFVGIGGIGMSALARYFLSKGVVVSGSDISASQITDELKKEGVDIANKHSVKNFPKDCDMVIYSEAIDDTNIERQYAEKNNINQKSYFEALGMIAKEYDVIAVAGTHGKSTTTAMLSLALENAGLDPTVFVGTKVFEWNNKNFRKGNSKWLVVEACEYRNSFLNFSPKVAVITSVEPEHLDFFETPQDYFDAFVKFLENSELLIADFSDERIRKIAKSFGGKKFNTGQFLKTMPPLKVPGNHNRENASKVMATFVALGLPLEIAKNTLLSFQGTWRRFEKKGEKNGIIIFDDYGHHPTEVLATLKALREKYSKNKIICVFQPHQFSRTRYFLEDFGKCFNSVDEVLIPNIYKVRDTEEDVRIVSAEDVVKEILKNKVNARYTEDFDKTVEILRNEAKSGDIIISMGAGPVNEITEKFLS